MSIELLQCPINRKLARESKAYKHPEVAQAWAEDLGGAAGLTDGVAADPHGEGAPEALRGGLPVGGG